MTSDERMILMREKLLKAFAPGLLEIIDDSEKHKGHEGAKSGAGHYTLKIQSEHFKNKSRVDSHREIYQVLAELFPHEIHALKIQIL